MTHTTLPDEILKTDAMGRVRTPKARLAALLAEFERSGVSGKKLAALVGVNYQTFAVALDPGGTVGDLAIFLLASPPARPFSSLHLSRTPPPRSPLGQRRRLLTLELSWLIPTALVPFGRLRALSLSKRLAVNASCQPHD